MWMWFLSTYIQMKSEPVFYGRSHLSSSMKLHTLVGLLMQRKHLHHQQTIHNNELKNGKNPHFQSSFTLFFCIYPRVQGQSHGLFVSRRLEKSKCNILLGQDAQSRQLSLTEKDRKQSPNLFWLQRGCKLYTYLDFRSRFFQILAKYSKFRCVFFMFQKRQKQENPYSTCLKTTAKNQPFSSVSLLKFFRIRLN